MYKEIGLFFVNGFFFKLYYLLDAVLPNGFSDNWCIAMQTKMHRHKPLGMLSFHRKSTKIVLIRENMEQFVCSNIPASGQAETSLKIEGLRFNKTTGKLNTPTLVENTK
jgi:hypothetical protein